MKRLPMPSDSTGFALIEILVALGIGLVVVGAVLASYLSNAQTGRLQSAAAQMDEDAQIGLRILTRELLMAGYAMPTSMNADTRVLTKAMKDAQCLAATKGLAQRHPPTLRLAPAAGEHLPLKLLTRLISTTRWCLRARGPTAPA